MVLLALPLNFSSIYRPSDFSRKKDSRARPQKWYTLRSHLPAEDVAIPYRALRDFIERLETSGRLLRVAEPVSTELANLFGTVERMTRGMVSEPAHWARSLPSGSGARRWRCRLCCARFWP